MVIQRIQSLLLLAAAVMMGIFTFCSLGQVQTTDFTFNFTSLGFFQEGIPTDGAPEHNYYSTWYFFILSLTTTILLTLDIFLFKNLNLQKKVCLISILFIVASAATGATLGYGAIPGGTIVWTSLVCAPFIALIATIMAYNRIQRDHNMLKSVDRIR
ncbi:MAG: DUF4293 domain-containing protein [Muribaculaceae bacterium]|nr:DUF4293 domain-containing protein [Muribaculaceae bacterium]MDE6753508.1 DUF4293 domain-containing protein [Muribaculaceae bacterium]